MQIKLNLPHKFYVYSLIYFKLSTGNAKLRLEDMNGKLSLHQLHPLNVYLNSGSPIEKELNWTFIIFGFTACSGQANSNAHSMNCERDENNLHEILN